jgi:hypothetical protein
MRTWLCARKLKSGYKENILQQMKEKGNPEIINYWKSEPDYKSALIFRPRGKNRRESLRKDPGLNDGGNWKYRREI